MRRVYIDGLWEDVLVGEPPFHLGQRVRITRRGKGAVYVCTEIAADAIRLESGLEGRDFATRFEAALWT